MDTLWSGGTMRTFRVYIPAIYDGQTPRPMVINFHGNTQTATGFENVTNFRGIADTANFILITPNGTVNPQFPQSQQGWSTFTCCSTVDDVVFVSDLIDTLADQYNIDHARIYASGFSNGGFMVYDLACKLSERIAAVASVAGTMITSRIQSCNPKRVVPVMAIHGTFDANVPFSGGLIAFADTLASVNAVLGFWAGFDGCSTTPVITNLPNINTNDGSTVQQHLYPDCGDGSSVEFLKVILGNHSWPGWPGNANQDIKAEVEIWRFFSQHDLNGTVGLAEKTDNPVWSVYPNPANDMLYISCQTETTDLSVQILDLLGRPMLQKHYSVSPAAPLGIELHGLPSGFYCLNLQKGAQEYPAKKFIISRQ